MPLQEINKIRYRQKTANEVEIYTHLQRCNCYFFPPLDLKVNLREYSKKIYLKSITFEAWSNNVLIGLIAAYFNDPIKKKGYITNVSVIKEFTGAGISNILLGSCIKYGQKNSFAEIQLEVNDNNENAISLYNKFGFTIIDRYKDLLLMEIVISKKST